MDTDAALRIPPPPRCGEEFNLAAELLFAIDMDYLFLWGLYWQAAQLHERLQGKLTSRH